MWIFNNEEIDAVITMADTLEVLEAAFGDLARGEALWRPRSDMSIPGEDQVYRLKSMDGIVPRYHTAAIRINSDVVTFPVMDGVRRQVKRPSAMGQYYCGFILLFDTDTGTPWAMFPDGVVQRFRVGATGGLGAKYLARADARVLAVIGSGWQAGTQVLAMCAVRPIAEIRVFSPNSQHRSAFVSSIEPQLPHVHITAVASFADAVQGADIVTMATNARDPLMDWDAVEPGMHITSVHWPTLHYHLLEWADVVVSNAKPVGRWQPGPNDYMYLHDYVMGSQSGVTHRGDKALLDPASPHFVDWRRMPDLGDLIVGRGPYRTGDDQVTVHANNIGIALQFAAVGARVVERAREQGLGREIPTEWWLETVHP